MKRTLSLAVLALSILAVAVPQNSYGAQAAKKETPAEKAEREERDALNSQAKHMSGGSEFAEQQAVVGTFAIVDEGKFKNDPYPKPIGTLTGRQTYVIMVDGEKMYNKLLSFDTKKVVVTGRIVKKSARGVYYLVDKLGAGVEQDVAPAYHPKHGGI